MAKKHTLTLISTKVADEGYEITRENKAERKPWSFRFLNVSWNAKHQN
jgi:hypothetical protein